MNKLTKNECKPFCNILQGKSQEQKYQIYEDNYYELQAYKKLEEESGCSLENLKTSIDILRQFFGNHKEFRLVKNSKENKFGLKLANDYDYITDYNFSGDKKDFELECFIHNISEDLFNALKEIGIYVEKEK